LAGQSAQVETAQLVISSLSPNFYDKPLMADCFISGRTIFKLTGVEMEDDEKNERAWSRFSSLNNELIDKTPCKDLSEAMTTGPLEHQPVNSSQLQLNTPLKLESYSSSPHTCMIQYKPHLPYRSLPNTPPFP